MVQIPFSFGEVDVSYMLIESAVNSRRRLSTIIISIYLCMTHALFKVRDEPLMNVGAELGVFLSSSIFSLGIRQTKTPKSARIARPTLLRIA